MSAMNTCQELPCSVLPDIAKQPHAGPKGTLDWVGMSEIEMPIFVANAHEQPIQTLAHIQAYVNLADPNSKGIHMSRLYLALDDLLGMQHLSPALLHKIVDRFVESHDGLSDAAYLECRFDYYEKRSSLLSKNMGWKSYPVKVMASLRKGHFEVEVQIDVPYSSTCPCSAALARQLIQDGFKASFGLGTVNAEQVYEWLGTTQGISATPHSQRSIAQVKVKLAKSLNRLPLTYLIDLIEDALKTPVQAAVKREDEQEFARLNAANLMFCEDAARRLKQAINEESSVYDFWIRVNHLESLHAHNAVSIVSKGIAGGYEDVPGDHIPC